MEISYRIDCDNRLIEVGGGWDAFALENETPAVLRDAVLGRSLLDFVAGTVINALMDVQLRTEVPVFSAVLTPQQFHEHATHFEFFRKHFAIKGIEVAEACVNTLHALERLRGQVAAGMP